MRDGIFCSKWNRNRINSAHRLPGMAPMGLGMLTKERMNIQPHSIKGIDQLHKILARAKELEK